MTAPNQTMPRTSVLTWLNDWRKSLSGVKGVLSMIAVGLGTTFVFVAIFAPLLAPYDPNLTGAGAPLTRPNAEFPMGTDELGRDQLSRVLFASRIALLAAIQAVGLAFVIGTTLGVIGALGPGWLDNLIQRLTDLVFAFPEFLLAIMVIAVLGPGLTNAAMAIGVVYAPRFSRIARSAALTVRAMPYVESSLLSGRSKAYILMRHILPNIATPLVVLTALSMSNAQLAYAALSFLGYGVSPPTADYGQMLARSRDYIPTEVHLVLFPGLVLVLLIITFNLLGDVLRDAFDPTLKRTRD